MIVPLKCLYIYWITLSAKRAVLPKVPIRATPHGSSVSTGGNRSTRRKLAMFGRVKLDNTLLTCDQGNFNQITPRSRNRILVTVVRDTCTTTVSPAPQLLSATFLPFEKLLSEKTNQFFSLVVAFFLNYPQKNLFGSHFVSFLNKIQ